MLRLPAALVMLAALLGVACGEKAPEAPAREVVLPLLQKEAASIKADGEKVNPALGVKSTWNVVSVEVQEQAGNKAQPWRGSIRFRIDSQMREPDGTETNDRLDKQFYYAYDMVPGKWRMQAGPPR
jgi:hypothetical protein